MSRHVDDGRSIFSFSSDVWVRCPKCADLAHVRWRQEEGARFGWIEGREARFGCLGCGLTEKTENYGSDYCHITDDRIRKGGDPFFGYDLWLTIEFRGHLLWFFNPEHLEYVHQYVAADVRAREPKLRGKANTTLTSRLPLWVKSAKNREALLKVMEKLHEKASTSR
jgi:hypothetical protein